MNMPDRTASEPMEPRLPARASANSRVRYLVLAWLCAAAAIAYMGRNSIGVAESTIRRELEISDRTMAWVMSSFFLAYALGQIPAGRLGDVVGSRRALPVFATLWSLATALMGMASGAVLLVSSRLLNGVAQAGLFPCCTITIAQWFPTTRRAVASGTLAAFMSVGGAIGAAATASLMGVIGWRQTFAAFGILGFVWSAGFYYWFRDRPQQHAWVSDAELRLIGGGHLATSSETPRTRWIELLMYGATWWICGQQFCRAAGQIFFSSWFATYLQQTHDVSVEQSGWLNSLPLAALVMGSLVGGAVSDWVLGVTGSLRWARSGVAAISMVLCAAFVGIAFFIQQPLLAVLVISTGTFCAAVGGPCAYTVTIDMGGRQTGVLFALMNMVGNLGAFVFIRLVPEVIRWTGRWESVLALFALLYVAAAFFWLLLNPNRTILDQDVATTT